MMTLWRTPENGFAALSAEMDRMVNRLARDGWAGYGLTPAADVHESQAAFEVVLDLPGLDAKAIDIHVENDTLTVKAERTQPTPAEGEAVHRSERAYGTFFRSFALPKTVGRARRVEARYDAGVLTRRPAEARRGEAPDHPGPGRAERARRARRSAGTGARARSAEPRAVSLELGSRAAAPGSDRLRHRRRLRRGCRGGRDEEPELRPVRLDVDADRAARLQLAEQDLLGERLLDLVLDEPRHRARAELPVEAVLGEPAAPLGA